MPHYLDHGYKRHDSLHVFLQFRQSAQLTCNHFVVRKSSVIALHDHDKRKKISDACKQEQIMQITNKSRDHWMDKRGSAIMVWTLHPHLVMLAEQG